MSSSVSAQVVMTSMLEFGGKLMPKKVHIDQALGVSSAEANA